MDDARFDALIQTLGGGVTRRGALGVLAGLAGFGLGEAATKRGRRGRGKHKSRRTGQVRVTAEAQCNAPEPGSNLNGCDFSGDDLSGRDLHGSSMRGANFSNAELSGADLHGSNARGANFSGANLCGAKLYSSTLRQADFTNANLTLADLHSSGCGGTTFTGATFCNTVDCNGDLRSDDCPTGGMGCCDNRDCPGCGTFCVGGTCRGNACCAANQACPTPDDTCCDPGYVCGNDLCDMPLGCCGTEGASCFTLCDCCGSLFCRDGICA